MLRRDFLADLARLAALTAVVPNGWRVTGRPRLADDPFQLGVASGDPLPDGFVLWTRLAPRPLEPEGGMEGLRVAVRWEVAEDEAFARIVQQGRAAAVPELSYSVHVDVRGLAPDRWYFYRFVAGQATSPVGRARTSPLASAAAPLTLGVASCQHWEMGLFTAYQHMAREELDLVAHLGDYIYEYGPTAGRTRTHAGLELRTLDDYRRRYAQYKSDAALQAAHLRCPWVVTWDDHEVDNNYAGAIGENGMESEEQTRQRRAAGYQAWWEHQPVRVPRARSWADLTIRRRIAWGALADVHVVDTRQYRSDQACDDGSKAVPCGEWASPARTLLGSAQERWLAEGLARSAARWQVLANQVMVASFDHDAAAPDVESMDQWSGYPAARARLLRDVARHAAGRTVVLTGDIHSSWVNELRADDRHADGRRAVDGRAVERRAGARGPSAPLAVELVGTSITSGGDGGDRAPWISAEALAAQPHVKWHDGRRGYLVNTITPTAWSAAYRTVPYVSRPDAPIATASRWRIEHGRAGVERE